MSKYVSKKFKQKCPLDKRPKEPLTFEQVEEMATGLIKYLMDKEMFDDARVYYRANANEWRTVAVDVYGDGEWRKTTLPVNNADNYQVYSRYDLDPNDYFEYNGDYLSMSFEGFLYTVLNHSYDNKTYQQLQNYFSWYGLYFELGNAWNLSVYPL